MTRRGRFVARYIGSLECGMQRSPITTRVPRRTSPSRANVWVDAEALESRVLLSSTVPAGGSLDSTFGTGGTTAPLPVTALGFPATDVLEAVQVVARNGGVLVSLQV